MGLWFYNPQHLHCRIACFHIPPVALRLYTLKDAIRVYEANVGEIRTDVL